MAGGVSLILKDLHERLFSAEVQVVKLARRSDPVNAHRLRGKAEGVALARSYVAEYIRGAHAVTSDEATS